jgi:hypothetical protein
MIRRRKDGRTEKRGGLNSISSKRCPAKRLKSADPGDRVRALNVGMITGPR